MELAFWPEKAGNHDETSEENLSGNTRNTTEDIRQGVALAQVMPPQVRCLEEMLMGVGHVH